MKDIAKHFVAMFAGALLGSLMFMVTENRIDPEIASIFGNVIIFIPFLFAFAQFDRLRESWQLTVITYGTSFLFGIYAAIMFSEPGIKGPIMWVLYLVAYTMALAVWMSGHQSRGFRAEMAAQFGSLPPYTRRLLGFLTFQRLHSTADQISTALLKYCPHSINWEEVEAVVLCEALDERHRQELKLLVRAAKSEADDWHTRLEDGGEAPRQRHVRRRQIWRR